MVFDSLSALSHGQSAAFQQHQVFCFVSPSTTNNAFLHSRREFRPTDPWTHSGRPTFNIDHANSRGKRKLSQSHLAGSNNNDDDDNKNHDFVGAKIFNAFFLDNSAVAYPLILGILALTVLPLTTSILAVALYGVYSFLGLTVVLEDYYDEQREKDENGNYEVGDEYEPPPVNFVAFVAALLTAGTLAPLATLQQGTGLIPSSSSIENFSGVGTATPLLFLGAVGIGAAATWFPKDDRMPSNRKRDRSSMDGLRDSKDAEKLLMELWDEQLENKSKDDNKE